MQINRKLFVLAFLIIGAAALFWMLNSASSNILTSNARAVHVNGQMYAVYFDMQNMGEADYITNISAVGADMTGVMGATDHRKVAIPKGSTPSFASDGAHIMVIMGGSELNDGEFITLTLTFEEAGAVQVKALLKDPDMLNEMSMEGEGSQIDHSMHGMGEMVEVDAEGDAPAISMTVTQNDDQSLRLNLVTENFEFFEPATEPLVHEDGQGHGHLYLNGLKLQRMYSAQATIGALPPGQHVITVTLNSNDHKTYAVDGVPVSASFEIDIK